MATLKNPQEKPRKAAHGTVPASPAVGLPYLSFMVTNLCFPSTLSPDVPLSLMTLLPTQLELATLFSISSVCVYEVSPLCWSKYVGNVPVFYPPAILCDTFIMLPVTDWESKLRVAEKLSQDHTVASGEHRTSTKVHLTPYAALCPCADRRMELSFYTIGSFL